MRFLSNLYRRFRPTSRILLILGVSPLIVAAFFLMSFLNRKSASANSDWYNDAWTYRRTISFGNTGSQATDRKVLVEIDTATLIAVAKMQADCGDVRFTTITGQILSYYLDAAGGACSTSSTDFWVQIPTVYAGETAIYMYYGNTAVENGTRAEQFIVSTFSPTSGPTVGDEESSPAPVAYWKFDEGQGQYLYSTTSTADVDAGYGSGGDINIGTTVNLNTTNVTVGRSCADGGDMVSYNVLSFADADTAVLEEGIDSGCLAAGDEVLLLNLQGTSENYGNVGNFETMIIASFSTTTDTNDTVNFSTFKTKYYGDGADADDTNLGTAPTNQRVILQRVPQYHTVTVPSGGTITGDSWNGQEGGVLFFRAKTVTVESGGSINMAGKGYRGGGPDTSGESYLGLGAISCNASGGGGGATTASATVTRGASAGYATEGQNGYTNQSSCTGLKGGTYGSSSLSQLFMGSGGGGPTQTRSGSNGGGIIKLSSQAVFVKGTLVSNGAAISCGGGNHFGGGGSGGSIYITGFTVDLGSNNVTADGGGGTCSTLMKVGGDGRIRVDSSSNSGTSTPAAYEIPARHYVGILGTSPSADTNDAQWQSADACIAGTCLSFDGSNDVVTVPDVIAHVQTVAFWVRTMSDTAPILALNESSSIGVSGGTITTTGFAAPTIYVDGVQSTTITTNEWHYVLVTTESAVEASAIQFGQVGADYGHLLLDEVKFYPYARTPGQSKTDAIKGAGAHGSSAVLGRAEQSIISGSAPPLPNPVLHLSFDEGYGTTAYDASPQKNNGAFGAGSAAPSWTNEGKFGKALSFDGNDYVAAPSPDIGQDFTFSAWINPTTKSCSPLTDCTIISMADGSALYFNNASTFNFRSGNSGNGANTSLARITTNQWQWVAGTKSGSVCTIFINGVKHNSASCIDPLSGSIQIGKFAASTGGRYFEGLIDEVKVYPFALTAEQVKLDYNQGQSVVLGADSTGLGGTSPSYSAAREYCVPGDTSFCNPPVAEWNFERIQGTTAYDTSGNNNNGTLTNGPVVLNGKVGKALRFDGVDDYITFGAS